MYLNVSERISSHDFNRVNNVVSYTESPRYTDVIEAAGIKVKDNMASSVSVEWTAIYWRKANQIHGWFVNKLADGVDECQCIRVTRDNLGFFFGGYEIDEYYWQDIEETHKQLTELLDEITEENKWNYEIEYQASW